MKRDAYLSDNLGRTSGLNSYDVRRKGGQKPLKSRNINMNKRCASEQVDEKNGGYPGNPGFKKNGTLIRAPIQDEKEHKTMEIPDQKNGCSLEQVREKTGEGYKTTEILDDKKHCDADSSKILKRETG